LKPGCGYSTAIIEVICMIIWTFAYPSVNTFRNTTKYRLLTIILKLQKYNIHVAFPGIPDTAHPTRHTTIHPTPTNRHTNNKTYCSVLHYCTAHFSTYIYTYTRIALPFPHPDGETPCSLQVPISQTSAYIHALHYITYLEPRPKIVDA
jgi:hypothetical protein